MTDSNERIVALVTQTFKKMWFGGCLNNVDDKIEEREFLGIRHILSNRVKRVDESSIKEYSLEFKGLVQRIIDSVNGIDDKSRSRLVEVISTMIQFINGQSGPNPTNEHQRIYAICEDMCDVVISKLVNAQSNETNTHSCVSTLYLFSRVHPLLLKKYFEQICMFLQVPCFDSAQSNVGPHNNVTIEIVKIICNLLPHVELPASPTLVQHLQSSLRSIMWRFPLKNLRNDTCDGTALLEACIECFCNVIQYLSKDHRLFHTNLCNLFEVLYCRLNNEVWENCKAIPNDSLVLRSLISLCLFAKHFDVMKQIPQFAFKRNLITEIENNDVNENNNTIKSSITKQSQIQKIAEKGMNSALVQLSPNAKLIFAFPHQSKFKVTGIFLNIIVLFFRLFLRNVFEMLLRFIYWKNTSIPCASVIGLCHFYSRYYPMFINNPRSLEAFRHCLQHQENVTLQFFTLHSLHTFLVEHNQNELTLQNNMTQPSRSNEQFGKSKTKHRKEDQSNSEEEKTDEKNDEDSPQNKTIDCDDYVDGDDKNKTKILDNKDIQFKSNFDFASEAYSAELITAMNQLSPLVTNLTFSVHSNIRSESVWVIYDLVVQSLVSPVDLVPSVFALMFDLERINIREQCGYILTKLVHKHPTLFRTCVLDGIVKAFLLYENVFHVSLVEKTIVADCDSGYVLFYIQTETKEIAKVIQEGMGRLFKLFEVLPRHKGVVSEFVGELTQYFDLERLYDTFGPNIKRRLSLLPTIGDENDALKKRCLIKLQCVEFLTFLSHILCSLNFDNDLENQPHAICSSVSAFVNNTFTAVSTELKSLLQGQDTSTTTWVCCCSDALILIVAIQFQEFFQKLHGVTEETLKKFKEQRGGNTKRKRGNTDNNALPQPQHGNTKKVENGEVESSQPIFKISLKVGEPDNKAQKRSNKQKQKKRNTISKRL
ncbi:hypothetical protein RFI_11876 [Reticulomyxa filosa]|uniref:Sister chromatid cohesion C-terminal domain-containing protein n=1 Tax=Reticulomyxa filosa TaxID=46433 RepID=X6NH85_RETFI|nr:hypothetical protein RFI_11876 [Reticulomyxa filosa]|eukprot:ETO25258.1 hypothetical protein RFI_11876 [Reticulomyxa filosa]